MKDAAEDLKYTLEILLIRYEKASVRRLKRRIKNYVYFLRSSCLRRFRQAMPCDAEAALKVEPLLTPHGQASLLEAALSAFRADNTVASTTGAASSSTPYFPAQLAAQVNQMQGHAGNRQVEAQRVTKPIKEQLKKARQRVDWASSSLQWMLFEDVLNYAKVHEGIADEKRCQNRAHQLWDGECFTNQLYSVQGESATKAEVFLKWSRMGYDRAHCEQWWADGANLVKLDGKLGSVDEGWKKVRMAEMRSSR